LLCSYRHIGHVCLGPSSSNCRQPPQFAYSHDSQATSEPPLPAPARRTQADAKNSRAKPNDRL
jgi:hypothetical protein